MKYLLIALLLAGAAWATEYWIKIGADEEGFYVQYIWWEDTNGNGLVETGAEVKAKVYRIDSLDEIRPTPKEMEEEPK